MKQNSLIEIGSKADVIIRFKSATNINGRAYKPNEPYLFLKDVSVWINYSNQDKTGSTDINVVAHSDIKPRTVSISSVPFSRKLASLLATYEGQVEFYPTMARTLMANRENGDPEGIIFLVDEFAETKDWFVLDQNFDLVEDVVYDEDLNALKSENFIDSNQYYISFASVRNGNKLSLKKPAIPYMSMEIQGIGNIDKETKRVVMYFDKVSLNSLMYFTFIQGEMINVPLEFHIIDDKNNYVVFEE